MPLSRKPEMINASFGSATRHIALNAAMITTITPDHDDRDDHGGSDCEHFCASIWRVMAPC